MSESYVRNVLEAALLAAGNPLPLERAGAGVRRERPAERRELRAALEALAAEYEGRGIELKETASGLRVQVRRELAAEISRLWPERAAALLARTAGDARPDRLPPAHHPRARSRRCAGSR